MRDENGRRLKGQSANPSGRAKVVGELKEVSRQHTPEALAVLVEVMNDRSAAPAARVAAAGHVLDRGYRKPPQALDAKIEVSHNVASEAAQVLLALSQRARERRQAEEAAVIDVTPTRQ